MKSIPASFGDSVAIVPPRWRGLVHQWALVGAVPAGVWLVLRTAQGSDRAVMAGYMAAVCAMLLTSTVYHRWRWSPSTRRAILLVDRSMIFLVIAAAYTPWALQSDGPGATAALTAVWIFTIVALSVYGVRLVAGWWWAPPRWRGRRWLSALPYFVLGIPIIATVPVFAYDASPIAALLVCASYVAVLCRGLVFASRWPDPAPQVFGYHEIFHVVVLAGLVLNTLALARYALPAA